MALTVPDFLDTQTYAARRLRRSFQSTGIQPGIAKDSLGTFTVSQRSTGANMTLDVSPGVAWVPGTEVPGQGYYNVTNDAAIAGGVSISSAHATLPRIDQVYLQVRDSTAGAAGDDARFVVVAGTPTAGATLLNRNGANGVAPASSLRLADVLVPAAAVSIVNANIKRRSPPSNGFIIIDNKDYSAGLSSGGTVIMSDYFDVTKDCDAVFDIHAHASCVGVNNVLILNVELDSVQIYPASGVLYWEQVSAHAGSNVASVQVSVPTTLTAGRHLVAIKLASSPAATWSCGGRQMLTLQAKV